MKYERLDTLGAASRACVTPDETGFSAAVAEQMATGKTRAQAVVAVCKAQPELHRAFLESTNPGRRQRELIADRFDQQEASS